MSVVGYYYIVESLTCSRVIITTFPTSLEGSSSSLIYGSNDSLGRRRDEQQPLSAAGSCLMKSSCFLSTARWMTGYSFRGLMRAGIISLFFMFAHYVKRAEKTLQLCATGAQNSHHTYFGFLLKGMREADERGLGDETSMVSSLHLGLGGFCEWIEDAFVLLQVPQLLCCTNISKKGSLILSAPPAVSPHWLGVLFCGCHSHSQVILSDIVSYCNETGDTKNTIKYHI